MENFQFQQYAQENGSMFVQSGDCVNYHTVLQYNQQEGKEPLKD
jgi:hypothetical protein